MRDRRSVAGAMGCVDTMAHKSPGWKGRQQGEPFRCGSHASALREPAFPHLGGATDNPFGHNWRALLAQTPPQAYPLS